MGERDLPGVGNRTAERGMRPNRNGSSRYPEVCQYGCRDKGSVRHLAGIERRGAAESAEEHLSTWALVACTPTGEVRSWKPVCGAEVPERLFSRVEAGKSAVGAHPEIPQTILQDAAHHVARKPVLLVISLETPGVAVEPVQAILGSNPHDARVVEVNRIHPIIAQGSGIIWVVGVDGEFRSAGIKAVKTRLRSAKPKIFVTVLLYLHIVNGVLLIGRI